MKKKKLKKKIRKKIEERNFIRGGVEGEDELGRESLALADCVLGF